MFNLLKMEKYQLLHNRVYLISLAGIAMLGFFLAESYLTDILGQVGRRADSLADIWSEMIFDSTFLLIIGSALMAYILGQEFSWRTISQEIAVGHSRFSIFASKLIVYLLAFNLLMLVFPLGGCLREITRFGVADMGAFFVLMLKDTVYSCLLNSGVFLLPILFCFLLKDMPKALITAVLTVTFLSLYFAYGSEFHLPVSFLPFYQIRAVVNQSGFIFWQSLGIALIWVAGLSYISWWMFKKADYK